MSDDEPESRSAAEIDAIKRQIKAGNEAMRVAAQGRGYKLHPRIAAAKTHPVAGSAA